MELRIRMKNGNESVKSGIDNVDYSQQQNTLTATNRFGRSHVYDLNTEVERIDVLNDLTRKVSSYGAGADLTFPANVRTALDNKHSIISGPRTTLVPKEDK